MKVVIACATAVLAVAPAFGVTVVYTTTLSGLAENSNSGSPGVGLATVTFDTTAHTLRVQQTFSGLIAPTTASHIHCCAASPGNAGVATTTPSFAGFPLGVAAGSMDQTYDTLLASLYNPAFVGANGGTVLGAEAALFTGLNAGMAYLDVHTGAFPAGEVRGFLTVAAPVPEPETYALLLAGLASLGVVARRRDRRLVARKDARGPLRDSKGSRFDG